MDGVKREVKEETGLEVDILKLIGVYDKPEEKDIAFSFYCNIVGGKIKLNDEADKIEYFELDDLPKNTAPKRVERIKDAFENNKEVIVKKQWGKRSINMIKDGEL
ncbi:MAG: hypothetical protein A3K03_08305 [Bdellovibrionales bacterium RIFOXYD1_FULL_44_7]|nr:MAG: hypothetical protein A3K03_08305 [Bdellovibrionales bacterium RIFOXYD1_FULL_44_7]